MITPAKVVIPILARVGENDHEIATLELDVNVTPHDGGRLVVHAEVSPEMVAAAFREAADHLDGGLTADQLRDRIEEYEDRISVLEAPGDTVSFQELNDALSVDEDG